MTSHIKESLAIIIAVTHKQYEEDKKVGSGKS